jgi:hypothetical protein
VKAITVQASAGEERLIRDPSRGHDRVSTMVIFCRLFEAFTYLDGIKRTPKVCSQDKTLTPTTSNLATKWGPKLKCSIPFRP